MQGRVDFIDRSEDREDFELRLQVMYLETPESGADDKPIPPDRFHRRGCQRFPNGYSAVKAHQVHR